MPGLKLRIACSIPLSHATKRHKAKACKEGVMGRMRGHPKSSGASIRFAGVELDPIVFTTEMAVVLGILGFTVFLFVSEIIRIDLAAILVMVMVGALSYLPGLSNLANISELFVGFSSNAVISIIAVMIIGAGLDKTGLMNTVAARILNWGGKTEKRIIPIISGTVAVISSFMQNVGAAALFLPVVSRISVRTEIPLTRLLMPMGFCAILGGTMTMVGSSPLILLNDLMETANADLPDHLKMKPFDLFAPLPIGISLIVTGILYFMLVGRWVLPSSSVREEATAGQSMDEYLLRPDPPAGCRSTAGIPEGNLLVGQTQQDVMYAYNIYIIGTSYAGQKVVAPRSDTEILTPCRLAILGERRVIQEICAIYDIEVLPELEEFSE